MIPSGWKSLYVGGMASSRARVLVMNAALGPLDYRVPHGMEVEPGSIVVAPLGPRQLTGIVWEPERLPSDAEVGDNRLRNLVGVMPAPPVRRSEEHTSELQSLMRISYA